MQSNGAKEIRNWSAMHDYTRKEILVVNVLS